MRVRILSFSGGALLLLSQLTSAQVTGAFVRTGEMAGARYDHTATLLGDGRVLITGGNGGTRGTEPLSSAELYDPATGKFTTTGQMIDARRSHSATLLPNGKVLIAGGWVSSAEIYDPATGTFTATGRMLTDHGGHSAILLPNGKVLIAGGMHAAPPLPTASRAELYDPETGTFSTTGIYAGTGSMYPTAGGPVWPTADLLANGKILLAGDNPPEMYDSSTGTFQLTEKMAQTTFRYGMFWHAGTTLADGTVLVTGGKVDDMSCEPGTTAAEIYDPVSDSFRAAAPMTEPREGHSGTLLRDGSVLLAGGGAGWCFSSTGDTAELYDPSRGSFAPIASMTRKRAFHTETLLNDGTVLLAGGSSYWPFEVISSAEIYRPAVKEQARGARRR